MKELIFSIADIFDSTNPTGCLTQYGGSSYYIPAYQRGYKWGSGDDGAVSVLLHDLWTAFEAAGSQQRKEYYLQYITLKPDNQPGWLEVIDGQQRLTTLSILVSVLAALLDTPNYPNYSAGKLGYAIRPNFFDEHIYDTAKLRAFVGQKWEEGIAAGNWNDTQDGYYLHAAARRIWQLLLPHTLGQAGVAGKLADFAAYLERSVKLIVNSVEAHIPGETIFKNLNSNKVPLTETELIKALIITRVGRGGAAAPRGFKEVAEVRLRLGRLWDEMTAWANRPEIRTFYFNSTAEGSGMYRLLQLVAQGLADAGRKLETREGDKSLPLFNFYNQRSAAMAAVYTALTNTYARLTDWYAHDDDTYRLLGFCRFAKNGGSNNTPAFLQDCLRCQSKTELTARLLTAKKKLLPAAAEVAGLRYGEHDDQLHAVLLALSVFGNDKAGRFNFHEFRQLNWSLEHIFPQSPEGKDQAPLDDAQRAAVKELIGPALADKPELVALLDQPTRDDDAKALYYQALQQGPYLNSIGNLCLLTASGNASNGCLPYPSKRRNVLRLAQHGSFVPPHTFAVFSKMLPQLAERPAATWAAWTKDDIDAHSRYITQHYSQL